MKKLVLLLALILAAANAGRLVAAETIEANWDNPPMEARLRAYWWWLNGNVTKESITHDLEEMRAKGFGGAVIFDADGASQEGNAKVPHGPTFFSPAWRELYKHTLRESARLGLEVSLNIQSGWNLGGPMVKAEEAAKKLVWSETMAQGPSDFSQKLPEPKHEDGWCRDLFVIALKITPNRPARPPIQNLAPKALLKALGSSAPDTSILLTDVPPTPGEEDAHASEVLDLTSKLEADGTLRMHLPAGDWRILRYGCTVGDHSRVSTCSEGWNGYALDVYDAGALKRYWDAVIDPLIADAGPLAGTTLKYLHTDSWEIEAASWTPTLREEFAKRRGYDLLPWLPVIAGYILDSREASNRFLFDFRKTFGELAIDHHYKPLSEWAHARKLLIHPESGGPHSSPFDAQECLGMDDAPMSEFWAPSPHRVGDANCFFVKQPASAAHTNGHPLVLAEGFTSIGPHWEETIWNQLKPAFDKACTEGLNRLVWHAFVCSPEETGVPGQQYFAGTHFNPKVTWWSRSAPFLAYINRSQMLLQRGLPVADVLYYYGDNVPNFAQLRDSDPAKAGRGFDYDVIADTALIERVSVKNGRLVLPDGVSYRALVLVDRRAIAPEVLRKIRALVKEGATVSGTPPGQATGLGGSVEKRDAEVRQLAAEIWNESAPRHAVARQPARDLLMASGVQPDFEYSGGDGKTAVSYIHRRDGETEIYFVASRGERPESLRCTFRVRGKAPELWNAVTGERRFAAAYEEKDGRVTLPLDFVPCGSWFVLFRAPAAAHPPTRTSNSPAVTPFQEIGGAWTVSFDPKWGGPASAIFDKLVSWTARGEPGIKFYSGCATYRQRFDLAKSIPVNASILLDLGGVNEIAEVRLNGLPLGIVWAPPFRVDITKAVRAAGNELEVDVVNFWPNRIIGDASLPPEQRLTQTNIRKLTAKTPLKESGLIGPVRLFESRP